MSMRGSRVYGGAVPTMPPGLVELMEGLAKDVLMNSPDNIYEFSAQHMKKLIEIRDGKACKKDSALIGNKFRSSQKIEEAKVTAISSNDVECKKDSDNEQSSADNNFNIHHESDKEIKIEQNQPPNDEDTCEESNKNTNFKAIIDDDVTELQVEIESSQIRDGSPYTSGQESLNDNEVDTILLKENIVKSIDNGVNEHVNDPLNFSAVIESSKTPTNEIMIDLLEISDVDKNCDQHLTSTNIQSVDKIVLDDTKDKSNSNDEFENTNNLKHDIGENESEHQNVLEGFMNDSPLENNNCSEDNYHPLKNNIDVEDKLQLEIPNETEEGFKENDMDVYNDTNEDMDLEKAAITIQKVFRAFLFKSKTLSADEVTNVDLNYIVNDQDKEESKDPSLANKERRSGIIRMDTVLQTVNEEKSLSLSTDDSSTLSSAATIIQAHVRGFLVRCKMPYNKTISTASVLDSDIPSAASFDSDQNQPANKTVLNIHIVPEGENFNSRDESLLTSLDLSLDGSPHHSSNLQSLGFDISERRKQLKREDAIQSVTPPSNNSGKLSEEVDSVKEIALNDSADELNSDKPEKQDDEESEIDNHEFRNRLENSRDKLREMKKITSDEADVVTKYTTDEPRAVSDVNNTSKLLHSGEFHDIVLPTMVSRSNSSVVRGE